jgi:hypothetical protein
MNIFVIYSALALFLKIFVADSLTETIKIYEKFGPLFGPLLILKLGQAHFFVKKCKKIFDIYQRNFTNFEFWPTFLGHWPTFGPLL